MELEPTPLITIAICTRNRAEALERAIKSVFPQLADYAELLIVDNGSTDRTLEVLRQYEKKLRFVSEPKPGISHARNRAVSEARGRYVLFFDDDEAAEAGWLEIYKNFLLSPPDELGAVGGPYVADFEIPPPTWINEGFGAYNLGGGPKSLPGPATPAAGNCAYLREALIKAGGFATDLDRSEDSELNLRLLKNGYSIWWLPLAVVRHFIPAGRLTLEAQLKMAFLEGRSAAVLRMRALKTGPERVCFWIGRMLGTPVLAIFQTIAAFGFLVLAKKKRGYRLLVRAARSLGIVKRLLTLPKQA